MFGQLDLAKVLAIGCRIAALDIACRNVPQRLIRNIVKQLTGSLSRSAQPQPAVAIVATGLVDEVPTDPTTSLSPSETAEDALQTNAAPSATSAAQLAEDDACVEARSSAVSGGAARAVVPNNDATAPAGLAEGCGRQTAVHAKHVQLKARRQQHKAKYNVPAELKAKEVQAEQAAAQLLQQQEEQEVDELEAAGLKRARKNNKGQSNVKQASLGPPGCIADGSLVLPEVVQRNSPCAAEYFESFSADGPISTEGGAGPLGSRESAADCMGLQREWEALLEQAAGCKDAAQQPIMLARLTAKLQSCSDAGISVKYGCKVLQQLQAVGPAREALQSALGSEPFAYEKLEAALSGAKGCRCLLEDNLVQVAEDVMAHFITCTHIAHAIILQVRQLHIMSYIIVEQADYIQQQHMQEQQYKLQQQQQAQQHAKLQPRRQAGQQRQVLRSGGRDVSLVESLTYPGVPAHSSTAGPRPAGRKDQQPTSDRSSGGLSSAAEARQLHTGRQVMPGSSMRVSADTRRSSDTGRELDVVCSTSSHVIPSAASGRQGQRSPQGCTGLINLGNKCYQNAVLQCLNCLPDLVDVCCSAATKGVQWHSAAAVGPATCSLLAEMSSVKPTRLSRQGPIDPAKFVQAVSKIDKRWGDGQQHDCQEFLSSLLAQMQVDCNLVLGKPQIHELLHKDTEAQQAAEAAESYARSWKHSCIEDLFGGLTQSTVTCSHCAHESHSVESFLDLQLPIPSRQQVSVQECLQAFTTEEALTGSNQVWCSSCMRIRDARKRLRIFSYPKLLVVYLKRFGSCSTGGSAGFGSSCFDTLPSLSKNQTPVRIHGEEPLDLAPYCSSTELRASACPGGQQPQYELLAFCQHSGRLHGGHYTAQGRSALDGRWFHFDDSFVTPAPCPSGYSSSPYLFFYRLLDS